MHSGGYTREARITSHKSGTGWVLVVDMNAEGKSKLSSYIDTDKGVLRIFRSVDAAVSAAKAIGFTSVTVVL